MSDEDIERNEYRRLLEQLEQETSRSYDKTLVALAGGAIAITMNVAAELLGAGGSGTKSYLLFAWTAWWLCLLAILCSFLSSMKAMRKAIVEVDDGKHLEKHGEPWNSVTVKLNIISAVLFILGGLFMSLFMYQWGTV